MDFLGIISNHYNALLVGAAMTAVVSAVSIAAGIILGLWIAFGPISRIRPIRRASIVYRSAWPILVQLLIVFYGGSQAAWSTPGMRCGCEGLGHPSRK